jgi:dolichol-phosphate mannosyltransferase
MILGLSIRDLTGGFNAWRRDTVVAINPDLVASEGYSFQIELKYRAHLAGKSIVESPIMFSERRAGQSKMSFKIVLEAMVRVWALRSIGRR